MLDNVFLFITFSLRPPERVFRRNFCNKTTHKNSKTQFFCSVAKDTYGCERKNCSQLKFKWRQVQFSQLFCDHNAIKMRGSEKKANYVLLSLHGDSLATSSLSPFPSMPSLARRCRYDNVSMNDGKRMRLNSCFSLNAFFAIFRI